MSQVHHSSSEPEKAKIVLIVPQTIMALEPVDASRIVYPILDIGPISALILPRFDLPEYDYAQMAAELIKIGQERSIAVLLDGLDASQYLGRLDADGLMLEIKGESWIEDTLDLQNRFENQKMIGLYGMFSKDQALTAGDLQPDVIMFGPLGNDIKSEPHRKNLKIAQWWAEMVEVPCIVPAGAELTSVVQASQTGADFIGLSRAIFEAEDPANAVVEAVQLIANYGSELRYEIKD